MGSELFTKLQDQGSGIRRAQQDGAVGPPEDFIIVGLDKSVDEMLALYPDDARARAIIVGVRDRTRTHEPPPPWFVATFARGQEEAASVANLGPDRKGKIRLVVVKGRKRNMALRAWNKDHPENRWDFRALIAPFKHNTKAGIDAELDAILSNATSNVFVAMPESGKADHAAMLAAKGKSPTDIAVSIGARDGEHVTMLLALAKTPAEVQAAVDAGLYSLADAAKSAGQEADEQIRRMTRATATTKGASGKGAKATRDAAAPPRAKTRPARVLESVGAELHAMGGERFVYDGDDPAMRAALVHGAARALAWARGAGEAPPWLLKAIESAEAARKGNVRDAAE